MISKEETEKIVRDNFDETINIIDAIRGTYDVSFEDAALTLQCDNTEKQFNELVDRVEVVIKNLDKRDTKVDNASQALKAPEVTDSREKTIVKGENVKLSKMVIKTVVTCVLTILIAIFVFIFFNLDQAIFSYIVSSGPLYVFYDIASVWEFSEMAAYLAIPLVILVAVIVRCVAYSKVEVEVTNKRIIGKVAFRKNVSIPMNKVCSVGMAGASTVFVTTPAGKIRFCRLKNKDAVYKAVSDLIIK